ncbi:unnamed protein product [marine sediment metagenome]|uniref:Uncharacterized protein n=1 Tax=marine sediment metagenome TaxID=412755 RepID=X1C712_9ZZZZ
MDQLFKFGMGDRVKDIISGFNGIVVTRIEYFNGCKRYSVLAKKLEAGKPIEEWIDEAQLGLVQEAKAQKVVREKDPGGPGNIPTLKVP